MRTGSLFALIVISLSSAAAQTDSDATFKAGVTVIQVPVTVRDHEGHVVSNLAKDDFQLFDNGKQQEIIGFSVESPGSKAPDRSVANPNAPMHPSDSPVVDIPERFIAYFFDDISFRDVGDLTRLRDAATKQIGAIQSGDRMAIFTSSCRVSIDFTNDQAKLRAGVARLVLNPTAICRASLPQKIQLELLKGLVRRMANLPGQRDVILISPGFFVGADRANEQADLIDKAAAAKVTIHAMDILERSGFDSQDPNGQRGGGGNLPSNPEVLTEIAHGTGGTCIPSSDYAASFRKLSTPESHYVLGFIPSGKPDGRIHQLKVKLENSRKLTVEARKGYLASQHPE